jgi:hypothetical protein
MDFMWRASRNKPISGGLHADIALKKNVWGYLTPFWLLHVNLNRRRHSGSTRLLLAASNGDEAIVRRLVDINPDHRGQNGNTPLICAAQKGHQRGILGRPSRSSSKSSLKDEEDLQAAIGRGPAMLRNIHRATPTISQAADSQRRFRK